MYTAGIFILFTLTVVCIAHEESYAEELLRKVVEIIDYMAKAKKGDYESCPTCEPCVNNPCVNNTSFSCPNGWIRRKRSCYFFVERKLTYSEARRNCLALDGQLIHIDDADENVAIVSYLRTLKEPHHWIGLTDIEKEGSFKWENGDKMTYSNWISGQPNNNGGNEDCTHFHGDLNYEWNDRSCSNTFASICEKSRK